MFSWQDKYHWDFSDEGRSAPDKGPAITGTKMFRGGHFKNVVRETTQNGVDQKNPELSTEIPVRMTFEYLLLDREDVPGVDRLSSVIDKCYSYMKRKPKVKMDDIEILEKANQKHLKTSPKVPALKISDYKTKGLTSINYENLMNNEGITYDGNEDRGGSFGFGKFAPYLLSPVNTVLYSSKTTDGKYLFQGRALLSTFEEEGVRKQGISLFGYVSEDGKKILPIDNPLDVPAVFRRDEPGTDLYILGFDRSDDWKDQAVFSALENFFYAIWKDRLEIVIKEDHELIEINSGTLDTVISEYEEKAKRYEEYRDFEFTAPHFWRVLNDPRTVFVSDPDFRKKGEVLLYILMGENVEGRFVLQMRNSGMKIRIVDNFKRLPPFNGVMIATGAGKETEDFNGNISKFLHLMESPAHNSWELEDIKKPEIVSEARKVIESLHNWIRNTVVEQMPKDDGTPIDAFGLSKILPDVTGSGDSMMEEAAVFNFVPLPVKIEEGDKDQPARKIKEKVNGRGRKPDPDPKPRPVPDPNREIKPRNNHQREKVVAKQIRLQKVSTPYLTEKKAYKLSFISPTDADDLLLEINVSGDDSTTFETSVISAFSMGKRLQIKDGFIHVPNVKRNEKTALEIVLAESEECALEVKAYVKS